MKRPLRFPTGLHPLHRQFLAYREGWTDGRRHSLEETAERFGIDLATARLTEAYLRARFQLQVDQTGWRAGHAVGW